MYKSFQEWSLQYNKQRIKRGNVEEKSRNDRKDWMHGAGSQDEEDDEEVGTKPLSKKKHWKAQANIPKGYASSLVPGKLIIDIASSEMDWWLRQWSSQKNTSTFGYQGNDINISYLCQYVERKILSVMWWYFYGGC